jgi:hypothetical protein
MGDVRRTVQFMGALLAAALLHGMVAYADTTIERSGSVLIFPKIVFDASRDTLVQITNTSNSMVSAHCFYVNATPQCSGSGDCLAGTCRGACVSQCLEVNFDLSLTKQQPTSWSAGFGRLTDPMDAVCMMDYRNPTRSNFDCYGAGLDPGRVPPVSLPFVGELKCIEVDPSGAPISGNHLKGEATIVTSDGDASKYNAIAVLGLDSNNGDNTLCLGGVASDSCESGAEYNACPDTLILDHFSEGADSPLLGPSSTVGTEVTLIPCSENFETQTPASVVVQFAITNEFEEMFSASTTVTCWATFVLDEVNLIFDISRLGTRVVQTRMRPAKSSQSGLVGVSEEYHTTEARKTTRAAFNLHQEGERTISDLIVIPEGP